MQTEIVTRQQVHPIGETAVKAVRELPERIEGSVSDVWINRGPTIATARLGPAVGRYAADLWRIEGNPFPWRVRADGEGVRRFGDEATAVTFFLEKIRRVANGTA